MLDLSFNKKTGVISGIISVSSPDNSNHFYCSLLFKSSSNESAKLNKYPITFYNSVDSVKIDDGFFEIKEDGVFVKSNKFLTPCQNLMDLKGETGAFFSFTKAKPFLEASRILSTKAYIYKSASDSSKTKMYLIKNNFISILNITNEWVRFEYMNSVGKRINGFIKKENVEL